MLVACLAVAVFAGWFYKIEILDWQLAPLVQKVMVDFAVAALMILLAIALVTLILGRVYCAVLCPLGIMQEILELVFRRKRKLQKNRPYKYLIAAALLGMMLGGSMIVAQKIEPYTIAGQILSGAGYGLAILAVLAVAVWFGGRVFCTNVCPVGAILGIMAKHSLFRIYIDDKACVACGGCAKNCQAGCIDVKNKAIDNETCVKCLKCLSVCPKGAIKYGRKAKPEPKFEPSRRRLLGLGAAVAVLAVAAKSGVLMVQNAAAKIKKVILPAGAGNEQEFVNRYLNCNLCVASCPMKIIKKANDDFGAVHIDYSDGFCNYDCHECSRVCPSGAIKSISLEQKQKMQIGLAVIDEKKCVKCGLCVMTCPRKAIAREMGQVPTIDDTNCIGCGACKAKCTVKAIEIVAVEQQKFCKERKNYVFGFDGNSTYFGGGFDIVWRQENT